MQRKGRADSHQDREGLVFYGMLVNFHTVRHVPIFPVSIFSSRLPRSMFVFLSNEMK